MCSFHKLYQFSKTRFGQNLLGVATIIAIIAACTAIVMPVYNRTRDESRHSNQDEANGRAISETLGFNYTGIYDRIGGKVVDKGTGILRVKPNGPFDRAGLKHDDHITLNLRTVKTLFIQQRGKMVVLPVQRAGKRRFNVTVTVPRFTVPYPELVPSTPVSPKP